MKNSLEGLRLLEEAWKEHDVCMHLADRYKLLGKILFAAEIVLSWVVVIIGSLRALNEKARWLHHALIALSLLASLLLSVDKWLMAKQRWRHLRGCASSVRSIIWCYRTRIGRFAQARVGGSAGPDTQLREALTREKEELMASANLHSTDLRRRYEAKDVYKHCQQASSFPFNRATACAATLTAGPGQEGSVPTIDLKHDNHYSPIKPDKYIELRLQKAVDFFQERIPRRMRHRQFLVVLILVCTTAASALAIYGLSLYVVIVTALTSAISTWDEYSDLTRKIERYNGVVGGVDKLILWWKSLGPVEQAGVDNITLLVERGEAILEQERSAWQSMVLSQVSRSSANQASWSELIAARVANNLAALPQANATRKDEGDEDIEQRGTLIEGGVKTRGHRRGIKRGRVHPYH